MGTNFRDYNYDKKVKVDLLNKQVEIYKDLIDKMELSREVVRDFNGKQCNVRLDKALKDSFGSSYNGVYYKDYWITYLYTGDNFVKEFYGNDMYDYTIYYVDCTNMKVEVELMEGTKKIDAAQTIKNIDKQIGYTQSKINTILKSIDMIDDMLEEYANIKKQTEQFNRKYPDCIRDYLGFRYY